MTISCSPRCLILTAPIEIRAWKRGTPRTTVKISVAEGVIPSAALVVRTAKQVIPNRRSAEYRRRRPP